MRRRSAFWLWMAALVAIVAAGAVTDAVFLAGAGGSPAAFHPQPTDGARFATARLVPERAAILAADGAPLTTNSTTIEIGLEPRRVKDRRTLLTVLQRATGVTPGSVAAKLDAPGVRS